MILDGGLILQSLAGGGGGGGKVNKLDMCDLFEQQTPITTIPFSETIPPNYVLCRMAHITIGISNISLQATPPQKMLLCSQAMNQS